MLDKTSEEYKKVKKLYKRGKISEEDCKRLLKALEIFEPEQDGDDSLSYEERADFTVGELINELGIKIKSSLKLGLGVVNRAKNMVSDTLKNAVRHAADTVNGYLGDEPEEEVDPCRKPEQYLIPYEKMYIKLHYIGKKTVELSAKTKKQKALVKKCEKLMSEEMCQKLNALLAESFVGKYECSLEDEYMRLTVRPKKV